MIAQNKTKPLTFALYISVIAFVYSIIEMMGDLLMIYAFEMPIVCLGLTWLLVHIAVTHRKHYWYDYVIVAILLLTWISSYVQIAPYYFCYTAPYESWTAMYHFPCIMSISHRYQIEESIIYDPKNVVSYSFDRLCLNFLMSTALFIGTLTAKIIAVTKSKREKKS